MRKSLRLRLVLGAALWIAIALAVVGFVLASLLRDFVERTFDERLNANLLAVMTAVTVDEAGFPVTSEIVTEPAFNQPFSGWYWQVANGRSIMLRSPSLWDQGFDASTGPLGSRTVLDALPGPNGELLRATTRDFTAPGGSSVLRVTVAGPTEQIELALDAITRPLFTSLGILGAGLILAVMLQAGIGLRPLDRLRHGLAAIRAGDARHLPDMGYAETAPLVRELNALIDHNEQVIERSRRHVGNLAHGLKTPLAVLANTVARSDDPAATDSVRTMERLVRHHLRRARSAASLGVIGAVTPLADVVGDVRFAMERIHAERDPSLVIEADIARDILADVERQDLEEMVGNLLDNACKWAKSTVHVRCAVEPHGLIVAVEDDGPGVAEQDYDAVAGRGIRLDEAPPGSGFGLAIVRDLAELYGGSLVLGRSRLGGLSAQLTLPGRSKG